MKYGDFLSLVQLGVGLHLGTALLQLYGEFGVQPLIRTIARIKSVIDDRDEVQQPLVEELAEIEADFQIFRIRLFHEFKFLIKINSAVAFVLVVLLIYMSYNAEMPLHVSLSVYLVALAVLPATITLGVLWWCASKEIEPVKARANSLERRVLRGRVN